MGHPSSKGLSTEIDPSGRSSSQYLSFESHSLGRHPETEKLEPPLCMIINSTTEKYYTIAFI